MALALEGSPVGLNAFASRVTRVGSARSLDVVTGPSVVAGKTMTAKAPLREAAVPKLTGLSLTERQTTQQSYKHLITG